MVQEALEHEIENSVVLEAETGFVHGADVQMSRFFEHPQKSALPSFDEDRRSTDSS